MRTWWAAFSWALLIIGVGLAFGTGAVLASDQVSATVSETANELLAWWADTALDATDEIQGRITAGLLTHVPPRAN